MVGKTSLLQVLNSELDKRGTAKSIFLRMGELIDMHEDAWQVRNHKQRPTSFVIRTRIAQLQSGPLTIISRQRILNILLTVASERTICTALQDRLHNIQSRPFFTTLEV